MEAEPLTTPEEQPVLWYIQPTIFASPDLSFAEKMLLSLVFSFSIRGEYCLLTDEWVSAKLGVSPVDAKTTFDLLILRGVIANRQGTSQRSLYFNHPDLQELFDKKNT